MQNPGLISFLIHIAGAAALLIWSVRLVRTGVERAFVVQLRSFLRRSAESRFQAALTGTLTAICLQSSTAVAVLISNFASKGGVSLVAGLGLLLGADLGSAIVSRLLLVRQDILIPLFLLLGVGMFLRSKRPEFRQVGRIMIGIGLIFVSLGMIRAATTPLMDSPGTAAVMSYLGQDLLTSFVVGALFAWVVHSSVAAVLFFVTLTAQGLLPVLGAAAMVLGANLGGSFIAFMLTLGAPVLVRRMVIANLALRGGGAAAILLMLVAYPAALGWLGATGATQVVALHLAFNFVLAVAGVAALGGIAAVAERLIPDPDDTASALELPSALDAATLDRPQQALNCATREVLRMGEHVEAMLRGVMALFDKWDPAMADAMKEKAARVREMHAQIKLFLVQLNREKLTDDESRQSNDLAMIALNIEMASDTIGRTLVGLARQKGMDGAGFSDRGWSEICDFHDRVLSNCQQALNVLMTRAPDAAREVVLAKERVRAVEQALQDRHLARLREGVPDSFDTSRVHQETLRALKTVNTCFTAIAYPVVTRSGDLLSSRVVGNASDPVSGD